MKVTCYVVVVMTLITGCSAAASTDPFIGKWVLNPELSKYPTGACPKSMVIEMEGTGRGIHYRSDSTFANGRTTHSQYTADYDGKQAVVMGNRGLLLPVFLKRQNARTVIASYTKGLQIVATSRRVVSTDGQRMTITTVVKDQMGRNITTIGIYEKQKGKR